MGFWHLRGGAQRCCSAPYNARDSQPRADSAAVEKHDPEEWPSKGRAWGFPDSFYSDTVITHKSNDGQSGRPRGPGEPLSLGRCLRGAHFGSEWARGGGGTVTC